MIGRRPQAALFDLDGTLADTAPDLAFALNQTLRHYGLEPLPEEDIRPHVSHGAMALIKLGFGLVSGTAEFEERRQYLLQVYRQHLCVQTQLFPGVSDLLQALAERQIPWGVVTNKPAWLTDPLMAAMALPSQPRCVVSGDTCARSKPDPMPIQHACALLGINPIDALYIGDAERDMQAGKAAGNRTICALFGYIQAHEDPHTWPVDDFINHPMELIDLIDRI